MKNLLNINQNTFWSLCYLHVTYTHRYMLFEAIVFRNRVFFYKCTLCFDALVFSLQILYTTAAVFRVLVLWRDSRSSACLYIYMRTPFSPLTFCPCRCCPPAVFPFRFCFPLACCIPLMSVSFIESLLRCPTSGAKFPLTSISGIISKKMSSIDKIRICTTRNK